MEIWCNESQERYVLGINSDRIEEFQAICERERCPWAIVGETTEEQHLLVGDADNDNNPVDMPLSLLLGKPPKMLRDVKHQTFTKPEMLVINGTSILNFFITQTGDPHDLFASYYVPVVQLLTQDKLTAPYKGELNTCNIYTRRIYDDYLMVEK